MEVISEISHQINYIRFTTGRRTSKFDEHMINSNEPGPGQLHIII